MTINPQPYIHKDPNIEVIPVTLENLEELGTWLEAELGETYTVIVRTTMGGSVSFGLIGAESMSIAFTGQLIAKDNESNIFVMDKTLLQAFYNPAV